MYVVNVPLFGAYGVQYPSMPDQVAYILFLRYCSILDLFVILFVVKQLKYTFDDDEHLG